MGDAIKLNIFISVGKERFFDAGENLEGEKSIEVCGGQYETSEPTFVLIVFTTSGVV